MSTLQEQTNQVAPPISVIARVQSHPEPDVPQPDLNGEFATPADGAVWMAVTYGIPQTPLRGKRPFLTEWQKNGSTDPGQIRAWAAQYAGCNFGSVAIAGKHFIFEADSTAVRERFKQQGHDFRSGLIIESGPGRGHRYYLAAPGVDNIGQNRGEDFSVRANGEQCVSPGSVHPDRGTQYRVAFANGPLTQPSPEEIQFWNSNRVEKLVVTENEQPIFEGSRNSSLASILGKARQNLKLDKEELYALGCSINAKRCQPPLPDSEIKTIADSIGSYAVIEAPQVMIGGKPAGLANTVRPDPVNWRDQFKAVGELEQGEVRMLIDGFLPEGTIFIGGLPGEGKTLFALSIAKALTTGNPFLGKFFIRETVPVVYLIPESSGRAFRQRCEKFGIPDDPEKFLCRTVSEGSTLPLDDGSLLEAIRKLRPVVVLDTIIRFSEAQDENQAMQNKALVDDIIRLRQAGAVAVIGLHHATKQMRDKGMTLETALRGTGDIAASADAVYGLLRDSMLYNNGQGPNEIDVACLKPRDFEPPQPFRIASSQKTDQGLIKVVSVIDRDGDFHIVSKSANEQATGDTLERLVKEYPTISLKELAQATGLSTWTIRRTLEARKWSKPKGGTNGAGRWTLSVLSKLGHPADVSFAATSSSSVN